MARTKQTARKTTKAPSSNLNNPAQDGNPDAVFVARRIVAYINESAPDGFSLAKLQDYAFETQENVQVSFLQENEQNGDNVVYIISMSGVVKIDQILREIPYKPKRQRGRKGMEMYQIARSDLDGVLKIANHTKNVIKPGEGKDESSSSDSGSEGEESGEESEGKETLANVDDAPRVLKKVKGPKDKKGKDKKAEVEKDHVFEEEGKEDNIEEEAAEVAPGKRGRGRGGKRGGGVSRVSKKKVAESGELATKNIDFDGEEGEEEKKDQGDENEDKKKKKKKEKPKSTQRKPVKTVPDTYKKGKFNTKVKVVTHHDLLQNKSNDPIDYGCTRTNNKNLIRAVYTQNYTLLDNLLRKHYFLSTLHEQWGPENETTALSLALKNRDVKAVKALLDYEYSRSYSFAQETPIHLQNVDTGNVSKAAFGVEIRKVNLMRGAREGNNAFTHDLTTHCLDFDALFELPMSKEILDYLRLKAGNHRIFSNIHRLIFSGDRINAGYLVNLANSVGGYGFNYLHEEALTKEKASELTPNIKRVSVTKKVIGNSIITPLHCAAINPNVEILDALLEIAPDYSIPDEKMRKLVHYAACCEKPGPLKLLISKGVDPREKDQTGLTPFMYACYYGRAENVEYLLKEASVDPLAKTKDGMMGSHWAASRGHLGVLKVLVENDVKMSVKGGKSKMTPLHFAAAYGYYDCVEYLVEHKSRVLVKDKFKRTPLSVAVRNGNLQIASYLLFNGSDFEQADSSNNFALHYAAAYGFTECIDILVKAGANVNAPNSWKLTALTVAMLKNNFHCVKALLAYPETDVNAKDDHGKSLISLLIGNPSEENFERIMYLIKERNCNVNTEDEDGVTPLHLACQLPAVYQTVAGSESLKIQLIKLLLEAGANINAKTKAGQFPLLFSITHFDTDLIELLIQQDGIDIAFHDRNRNNLYRLLYQHTIHNDERREFLKRILKKVGNVSNLLNELKNDVVMSVIEPKPKPKPKTQNQNYSARERGHRRKANYYNDEGDGEGDDEDEDREENEEEEEEIEEEEEDYDMVNNNIHTYIQPNPHATDPLSCNESVFTCFKRTLMNPSLQSYINTEINQALDAKRGSYGYSYYNYNVQLTEQETAECHEKAYNKFDPIITKNLDLIGEFVKAGATLSQDEASILRSEYSNDPRFLLWVLEMYKTDLNIADPSGNPVLYNLITRRNNLEMTPNAKQFLVDYLINHYGLEADTLSKYSDFKLFLEIYHRFGANFNYRNKTGTTPILYLLKTCDQKNADFLMDLIFYGADIHQARDNDGSTPFLEAIYFNDLKLLEVLVSLEVDINHKSKVGKAPLHYITEMNLPTTVTAASIVLKLKNIDVNIRDQNDDRTPLHYAILKGERDLVVVLLQAGADPNTTDRSGCNSLYFATQIRNSLLMREIGAITKNPSAAGSGGSSPLHLAVRNGTEEHVDILLKLGANPNAKDNTGSSPLHLAVRNGNEKQVEMLLKLGADPNLKDDTGKTSLLLAVMDEKFEIAKALLASGGNPNEKDKNDRTCLHYAVNNSKPEQMFEMEDMLIRNKADVNAIDIYGRTPLHYSFISIEGNYHFHNQNDPVETVTSLSAMEITNISLKDRRGKSPLHYAAENGAYICVLLLLKRQVAFDDPDADGNTPLALSLNAGHKDTAAILIQNKAKVSNMIHHINPLNYLWDDPKDNPYNHVKTTIEPPHDDNKMEVVTENEGEKEKKEKENGLISKPDEKGEEGMETEQPELVKGSMNVEEEQKDKESDDLEEEEEQIEEGGTEDLDPEELKTRELEMQRMDLPVEVQVEEKKVEQETVAINSSQFQRPVDSFFAVSIRRGWQGIAYLLLQNGFNLMEAIRDAMNEHQFKYVVALMTKVQDEVVRKSDHNNQNLFHIFAIKGLRAPVDLAKKIFEGLINRGVDSTSFDSFGKAPIHYAAENSFIYLEDRLLENKVDSNTLDKDGLSILHIAARTNNLNVSRLQKFVRYKIDINAMFNQYGRKMTPLHYIAEQGNEMVEREMLRLGADPNLEDSEELTALQRVFIRRSLTTSRLITYLNEKANINKIFNVKYDWSSRNYTLLLYAAEKAWSDYEDVLLNHGADARIEDEDHRTAFSISFSQRSPTMQLYKLRLYIQCQAPIRTLFSCKIRRRTMKVTPVLYLLNTRENLDLPFIKELLDSGVSINDTDDDGYSPIIYAIRRNNMQYLKLFLEAPGLDKNMRDKYGKTPIHHVVNPMDYASYENTEMLEVLAAVFDINAHDNREKPPIYYAYFQDSGTMKKALLELGAIDHRPANELQRQATSIIAGVEWPEEVDFEVDAEKYLVSQENSKMLIEKYESEPVDECAHNRHNLEVVCDETLGSYSLYMTKIDIKKGEYGEYLFYRMQVLYDKNRDNYILLTKWGRIGEQGMHQETPFGTKDECINEFSKIFRDKSGNEWKNKTKFQKFDHKYKLLNTSTRKNQNDYLQPIDWNDKTIPRSRLDLPIRNIVKAMSDVKLYHSWFGRYNINTKLLPFGRLSKDVIFEAKKILLELKDLIEELQGTGTYTDEDVQTVLKLKEKIMDNSSKYYELIPNNQYRFSPVQPIQNVHELVEKVTMVNDMIDFEVSAKILLGAMSNIKVLNPLDYCFDALGIRLMPLTRKQREHKLITQYVKNGYPGASSDFIEKIFALERRGEAERISQWKGEKNRMYLWHGSKLINFMGILSQGLRIAPPEAPATGYMFGKGIYFADTFSKSYGYCQNYNSYGGSNNNTKLLILCEVALGEIMEHKQANYITKLPAPYNSVLGRGRQGPDPTQNITLANGAIVPIGKHIQHVQIDENGNYIYYSLNYNEYIVYDVSQVRMRYLVQVK